MRTITAALIVAASVVYGAERIAATLWSEVEKAQPDPCFSPLNSTVLEDTNG